MQLHLGLPLPAHPPQLLKPCGLRHNLPILSLACPTFTMTASLFLFLICCWLKDLSSALLPRAEPDKSRHTWGRRSGPTQVAARQLIITLLFVYHSFVCLSLLYLFINPLFVYHSFVCLPLLCFWPPKYWRHKKFEPPTAEGDHCCCLQLICCFKQLYCLCDFN